MITPYRQQIKMLSAMLQDLRGIEVMTSDKSQGRDKDCIIISMVRSNDLGNVSRHRSTLYVSFAQTPPRSNRLVNSCEIGVGSTSRLLGRRKSSLSSVPNRLYQPMIAYYPTSLRSSRNETGSLIYLKTRFPCITMRSCPQSTHCQIAGSREKSLPRSIEDQSYRSR